MLSIVIVCIVGMALVISFFIAFDRIVAAIVSRYSGLRMTYSRLSPDRTGKIIVRGLELTEPKSGLALHAEKGVLKPRMEFGPGTRFGISFTLEGAHFNKHEKGPRAGYSTFSDLAVIPFQHAWNYSVISGDIVFDGKTIEVRNFKAQSADIRLDIKGSLSAESKIDATIKVSFSGDAGRQIPEEIAVPVLQDEGDGWKYLTVRVQGDYRAPAVQISSKLFRLDISNK